MFERLTERARRVLVLAQEESRSMGHDHIGAEHLLLGIVCDGDALGEALEEIGLAAPPLRAAIAGEFTVTDPIEGRIPFSALAKRALGRAQRSATELGDDDIGKIHLLVGVGQAAQDLGLPILEQLGVDGETLEKLALELREAPGPPRQVANRVRPPERDGEVPTTTPYCAWCDSPFAARWWFQRAPGGPDGSRELSVVVLGCGACGTVVSVVPPPASGR